MAQMLKVFKDPSIVANHPSTPLELLQNALDKAAPGYIPTAQRVKQPSEAGPIASAIYAAAPSDRDVVGPGPSSGRDFIGWSTDDAYGSAAPSVPHATTTAERSGVPQGDERLPAFAFTDPPEANPAVEAATGLATSLFPSGPHYGRGELGRRHRAMPVDNDIPLNLSSQGKPAVPGAFVKLKPAPAKPLAAPRKPITHEYAPVKSAGERTDVAGNDMAFMPKSVQTSSRWNTGY